MNSLIIPRRKFLIGTATLMANVFVAPSIVRASSLMDINTLQNRLVVAFKRGSFDPWCLSLLNLGDYNQNIITRTRNYNGCNYSLMRRADVSIHYSDVYRDQIKMKFHYERLMDSIDNPLTKGLPDYRLSNL